MNRFLSTFRSFRWGLDYNEGFSTLEVKVNRIMTRNLITVSVGNTVEEAKKY